MRAMFSSKFGDLNELRGLALENAPMLNDEKELYVGFADCLLELNDIQTPDYEMSVGDLYKIIRIKQHGQLSKRRFYEGYDSGVVVGAGSGEDCVDLIEKADWWLYDLTDERMINMAVGHTYGKGMFNIASSCEGDTMNFVSSDKLKGKTEIDVITVDGIGLDSCDLISVDSEGSGLDVLQGAQKTISKFSPDLLLSIYHSWEEYLLIIPMVYDLGYKISVVKTANFTPSQPHLELTLFCTKEKK